MTSYQRTGKSQSKEYQVWTSMMRRCYDPLNPGYATHGGRGIKVCKRWHDMMTFLEDMGPKPGPRYRFQRINKDVGFEISNCHWTEDSISRRVRKYGYSAAQKPKKQHYYTSCQKRKKKGGLAISFEAWMRQQD